MHVGGLQGLPSFHHDRAKTDRESTTMLSPWIHFGTISVRHIYYRCELLGCVSWQDSLYLVMIGQAGGQGMVHEWWFLHLCIGFAVVSSPPHVSAGDK